MKIGKDTIATLEYTLRYDGPDGEVIEQYTDDDPTEVLVGRGVLLDILDDAKKKGGGDAFIRAAKGKVSVPILRVWKDSQRVIREFKEHKNAVLFAAGSCWEGMDFPGDMVSSLIIVRLPFPVPDPVREAERERYQSLQEYIRQIVVPDMQLKLRQGFGRAIRTETDTCVVSILDSRAARGRRYHEAVLEALPRCQMTEDIGDVERFIREKKGIDYYM